MRRSVVNLVAIFKHAIALTSIIIRNSIACVRFRNYNILAPRPNNVLSKHQSCECGSTVTVLLFRISISSVGNTLLTGDRVGLSFFRNNFRTAVEMNNKNETWQVFSYTTLYFVKIMKHFGQTYFNNNIFWFLFVL